MSSLSLLVQVRQQWAGSCGRDGKYLIFDIKCLIQKVMEYINKNAVYINCQGIG